MPARKIHFIHKFATIIIALGLISGCATAPPTQEMSDARQSLEAAENIGAEEHAPLALDSAQFLLSQAENDIQAGEFEKAQKDAIAAREAARQAFTITQAKQAGQMDKEAPATEISEPEAISPDLEEMEVETAMPTTTTYTVKQHDNLWSIAAQASVYADPLLWPLIYKTNVDIINNADLIFPNQTLTIEITPSDTDKEIARQFANHRGINSRASKDTFYLRQYGLR